MAKSELLILEYGGFSESAKTFIEQLATSEEAQARFLDDPNGTLSEDMFPTIQRVSKAEIGQANRLLFALLRNQRFMTWAHEWQERNLESVARVNVTEQVPDSGDYLAVNIDKQQLYEDVAGAISEFADRDTMQALIGLDRSDPQFQELESYVGRAESTVNIKWPPPPKPVIAVILYALAAAAVVIIIAVPPLVARQADPILDRQDLRRMAELLANELRSSVNTSTRPETGEAFDVPHDGESKA